MQALFLICCSMTVVTGSSIGYSSTGPPDTCELPDCLDPSHNIPADLKPQDTPRMVVFSFDDAVTVSNIDFYRQLFTNSARKNPNGCPISMTLFVSYNYTDYNYVRELYNAGIEIASHSVTHRTPTTFWKNISKADMLYEAGESKRLISELAQIPVEEVRGWRAPYHQTAGDVSIETLQELGYEYDSSLVVLGVSSAADQQWPFTFDSGYPHITCVTKPCPTSKFKGFWEVPVVPISDREDMYPCIYIDGCYNQPKTKEQAVEILMKNFNNNKVGRAPLYINMHAGWFTQDFRLNAMHEFIDTILKEDDVYIVNFHQLLEWVRKPTALSELEDFVPWSC